MRPDELPAFLGGAAALAAAGSALALGALAAVRGRQALRAWPLVLTSLFFLALTQYPFPDPSTLACPAPRTEPLLIPFRFVGAAWSRWARRGLDPSWVMDVTVMAAAMNLVLCAAIGAALARHAARARAALLFGAALSLGVELTQLTGLWGLYPCAYRQFDVDDLILNVAGVLIGFLAARRLGRRSGGTGPMPRSRRPDRAAAGDGGAQE